MLRSFIMGILAFALSGCLASLPTASRSTPEPVPTLKMAHSEETEYVIRFLEFSEDGKFLAIAGNYDYVHLYNVRDYTPLEEFILPRKTITRRGQTSSLATELLGLGFIDANTWYFVADGEEALIHIRTIQPSREIFRHIVGGSSQRVVANENHVLIGDYGLINWRTGKNYSSSLSSTSPGPRSLLTRSGYVLRASWYHNDVLIDKPENGISERWRPGFQVSSLRVTPDERYLITTGRKGACKLWRWPEKQEVASCGLGGLFRNVYPALALSPDGKRFAVSEGNTVRLYTIEPFRLELEVEMPGEIRAFAVTNDGKLAASGYENDNGRKRLHVWDVAAGGLIGQFDFDPKDTPNVLLAFQPGSNRLAVAQSSTVIILELPERAMEQAAP
jgi:WD40 repeat protein